jgi:ribose transport system ATP-binding protein
MASLHSSDTGDSDRYTGDKPVSERDGAIPEATLALRHVSKTFDGVTVLSDVSLEIRSGEVHGLVGENGSGKSTLVKIVGGVHTPDSGSEVWVGGRRMALPIQVPQREGVAIIHQDLALVDGMTVADNVGISVGYDIAPFTAISRRREARVVRELASQLGITLEPSKSVGQLSPAERSVVAILRGLRSARHQSGDQVLILDEPTAALPRSESQKLLGTIRAMAEQGFGVVFISHRMQEVLDVCDRVSVLRSGKLVGTREARRSDEHEIVRLMLGYDLGDYYPDKHYSADKTLVVSIDGLTSDSLSDLKLEARAGEILGITGLAGMGQDDLPYLIAGGRPRAAGSIRVGGEQVDGSPREAKAHGVELVPANRQRDALWLEATASENLTLPFLGQHWRRGRLKLNEEQKFVLRKMTEFGVRPANPKLAASKFSGGNQQKVVMARALHTNPKVLLLHEPTQGVDPGAKKEILRMVRAAADDGRSVLVFSSDMEEMAEICHRVLIMKYGSVSSTLEGNQVTEANIIAACQSAVASPKVV